MWMKVIRGVLLGLVVFFVFFGNVSAQEALKKSVRVAVLPCTEEVKAFISYQPLMNYLQKETGIKVELIVPKDADDFELFVKQGKVDFTFQEPNSYLRLAEYYNDEYAVGALSPQGKRQYRAVLIARKDSGIREIKDLKGKVVVFGNKLSLPKWIAAKKMFEEKGMDIDTDLNSYFHVESCENTAVNVYMKTADAGMLCDYSYKALFLENEEGEEIEMDPRKFSVIAQTKLIPGWVFSAGKPVPKETAAAVINALLKLDSHKEDDKEIIEPVELGGFVRVKKEDFAGLIKLLSEDE